MANDNDDSGKTAVAWYFVLTVKSMSFYTVIHVDDNHGYYFLGKYPPRLTNVGWIKDMKYI